VEAHLTFALIQHDIVWLDCEANFRQFRLKVTEAAARADFIILPETFSTGFVVDPAALTPSMGQVSKTFLLDLASELRVWISGSFFEKNSYGASNSSLYSNTFFLAGPNGESGEYRKLHPFAPGGEDFAVTPGEDICIWDVNGLRVTPFVCYDLRFANVFWDAAQDTDVFIVTANWPQSRQLHWETLIASRAIENQAFVIGCNRIGTGNGILYAGGSQAVGPTGHRLCNLQSESGTLIVDVNREAVTEARSSFPFIANRRPRDSYCIRKITFAS